MKNGHKSCQNKNWNLLKPPSINFRPFKYFSALLCIWLFSKRIANQNPKFFQTKSCLTQSKKNDFTNSTIKVSKMTQKLSINSILNQIQIDMNLKTNMTKIYTCSNIFPTSVCVLLFSKQTGNWNLKFYKLSLCQSQTKMFTLTKSSINSTLWQTQFYFF